MSARILWYSVKNYGPFGGGEQKIDFETSGNIIGLYGKNGCGKTSFISALAYHLYLIDGNEDRNVFDKREAHFGDNKNTISTISFSNKKDFYIHTIEYKNDIIMAESLIKNDKIVFTYNKNTDLIIEDIFPNDSAKEQTFIDVFKLIKNNRKAKKYIILPSVKRIVPVYSNIEIPRLSFYINHKILDFLGQIIHAFINIKDTLNDFLPLLDHTIESVKILNDELCFEHIKEDGTNVWIPLEQESRGIQNIVKLLNFILAAIYKDQILIIDEIENSLHPDILKFVIELFKKSKKGKLIFTTHNFDTILQLKSKNIKIVYKIDGASVIKDAPEGNIKKFKKEFEKGEYGSNPVIQDEAFLYKMKNIK